MGHPLSQEQREAVIRYFQQESHILRQLMKKPGAYRMPECIYEGNITGWIDDLLVRSPSNRALQNRICAVINGTEKVVLEKMRNNHGRACLISLGCGAVRDTVEMMRRNSRWNGCVRVECIDRDMEKLAEGKEFARVAEVESVNFVRANMLSLPHREKYDVGLLIGVLCAIPVPQCVATLKEIRPYFKKGGVLIASNVTPTMVQEDPLMSYILSEFVRLNLVYKAPEQLRHIFELAGYEWKGCFYDDPCQFHCIGIGTVN